MKRIVLALVAVVIVLYMRPFFTYKSIDYKNKKEIKHHMDKKLLTYNSSISKENDDYVIYSRVDNMISEFHSKRRVYLGVTVLDKDFNVKNQYAINTGKDQNKVIEDLRVFFVHDKKYFIGTIYELVLNNIFGNSMFYPIMLDEMYNTIDVVDEKGIMYNNKNLVPYMIHNNLYFIKNHNPLEILKVVTLSDKCYTKSHYKAPVDPNFPKLRGNTLYIPYMDNKLLGITHTFTNSLFILRNYTHYLTILDVTDVNKPFIERISDPLCLTGFCGVEFVMGLTESFDKNSYLITLGKEDKSSFIIEITKDYVYQQLYK